MLICDTHADTLYAMQKKARSPALLLDVTRERLLCTEDVRVQALALFTGIQGLRGDEGLIERELKALETLKKDGFHQITRLRDAKAGVANLLLTAEGGEIFHGGADAVIHFFSLGVRIAGLVWNHPNQLAYPAVGKDVHGLTRDGCNVVRCMHALGMAVDISHLNEQGVLDLLELGGAPPLASHSCARALCDHPRNLTDEQLRSLIAIGGYVGVNFYPPFLHEGKHATLDTVIDHISHICDLGGEENVGLGSDFDGIDSYPTGLRHAGDVPKLFSRMRERDFDEELVRAIAGKNFQAYMERVTSAASTEPPLPDHPPPETAVPPARQHWHRA